MMRGQIDPDLVGLSKHRDRSRDLKVPLFITKGLSRYRDSAQGRKIDAISEWICAFSLALSRRKARQAERGLR